MLKQVTNFIFALCWLVIGLTSAYDLYLLVSLRAVIQEQNPIGRWLIEINSGDVSLFAALKMAGTIIALGSLFVIFRYLRKIGLITVVALAFFQFLIIVYQSIY